MEEHYKLRDWVYKKKRIKNLDLERLCLNWLY